MRIAIDGQGGDVGPGAAVAGTLLARDRLDAEFVLLGDPDRLRPHLSVSDSADLEIQSEKPEEEDGDEASGRRLLARGLKMVRQGGADAFVSAADTGEVLLSAVRHLGRAPGVQRPCIAAHVPTPHGYALLLDAGANPECQPEHLVDFALMGAYYAAFRMKKERPSVYLLSNGEESGKGTPLIRAAHVLLGTLESIDYRGFAEPYELAVKDKVDVLITDGFSGNVLIKGMETASRMYAQALREAFSASWSGRLGYGLARSGLEKVRTKADPRQYGGALLLGLQGIVVVAHGSCDAEGFSNAVRQACEAARQDVAGQVARAMDAE